MESSSRGSSRRAPRRATLLILIAVIAVVVIAVVLLSSRGSGSTGSSTSAGTTSAAAKTRSASHHKASSKAAGHAANPAETTVTVLNGTEKAGLAHQISGQLQQRGYSQAAALSGRPAGANQVTVVEYASGHQADGEGVAHTLGVSHLQPLEGAVGSLAGSAKVVVIVGADEAAKAP